jgi:putative transposase
MSEVVESTGAAEMIEPMTVDSIDQKGLAEQLLAQAKEQNVELVGPDGLLGQLTDQERARDRAGCGDERAPGL